MDALFKVHRLNKEGLQKTVDIAEAFDGLLGALMAACPPGREFAIVKTKLEEACFFAKKAIANDKANQL